MIKKQEVNLSRYSEILRKALSVNQKVNTSTFVIQAPENLPPKVVREKIMAAIELSNNGDEYEYKFGHKLENESGVNVLSDEKEKIKKKKKYLNQQQRESRKSHIRIPEGIRLVGFVYYTFVIEKKQKKNQDDDWSYWTVRAITFERNFYTEKNREKFAELGFDANNGLYIIPDLCFRTEKGIEKRKEGPEKEEEKREEESLEPALKKRFLKEEDVDEILEKITEKQSIQNSNLLKKLSRLEHYLGLQEEDKEEDTMAINGEAEYKNFYVKNIKETKDLFSKQGKEIKEMLTVHTAELSKNLNTKLEENTTEQKKKHDLALKSVDASQERWKLEKEALKSEMIRDIQKNHNILLQTLSTFFSAQNQILTSHIKKKTHLKKSSFVDEELTFMLLLKFAKDLWTFELSDLIPLIAQTKNYIQDAVQKRVDALLEDEKNDETILVKFPQLLLDIRNNVFVYPLSFSDVREETFQDWRKGNLPSNQSKED